MAMGFSLSSLPAGDQFRPGRTAAFGRALRHEPGRGHASVAGHGSGGGGHGRIPARPGAVRLHPAPDPRRLAPAPAHADRGREPGVPGCGHPDLGQDPHHAPPPAPPARSAPGADFPRTRTPDRLDPGPDERARVDSLFSVTPGLAGRCGPRPPIPWARDSRAWTRCCAMR
jgi:hypothetical protein